MVAARDDRIDEAITAYRQALALEPDNMTAHNEIARLQLLKGEFQADNLAQAAEGFAAALRADPRAALSRSNFYFVLHMFLSQVSYRVLLVAVAAAALNQVVDAELVRLVPALLLAYPAFFILRFVFQLAPQLRAYLIQVLRDPFLAGAVFCDAIAVAALVVGAASQRTTSTAFWCAAVLSFLARRIMQWRTQSRFAKENEVWRGNWLGTTLVLVLASQLAFGPSPDVMSSTGVALRVAAGIGAVAVAYAYLRRIAASERRRVAASEH